MKVALAGGGDAQASRAIDEAFASWLPNDGRLLYIPNALGTEPATIEAATEWIVETFAPIATFKIDTRTDLWSFGLQDLLSYDGVYIGGGNTYSLLHEFRSTRFFAVLLHAIRRGLCVYGGSAGAAVLGADISTVRHMDQNDVGITDTAGLDLAAGRAVWVHYADADADRVTNYVSETGQLVIAIPEDAGVVIAGNNLSAVGSSDVVEFKPQEDQIVVKRFDSQRSAEA